MKFLLLCAVLLPSAALADEWGLGLRAVSQRVDPEGGGGNGIDLGGGGVLVRWRLGERLSLEVGLDGVHGQLGGGAYDRRTTSLSLAGIVHLTPGSPWNLYVVGGLGTVTDRVTFIDAGGNDDAVELKEGLVRLGGGLEHRWQHIGVGIEASVIGLWRTDDDAGFPSDLVPHKSGGGQLGLQAAYYF